MVEAEAPTIRRVTEEGAWKLFYYYGINILSIFSLKQSDLPAVERKQQKRQTRWLILCAKTRGKTYSIV